MPLRPKRRNYESFFNTHFPKMNSRMNPIFVLRRSSFVVARAASASFVVAALALAAASASAAGSNYQRYVLGDRSGGMGGAAVAGGTGVDASYYNPAGLASTERDSLSFSANLYGVQRRKIKGGLEGGDNVDSDSVVTIPAMMGGVWRLSPDLVFAMSAIQPDRFSAGDLTLQSSNGRVHSYSSEDQSVWIGPSLAWKASSSLSVGASIYGVYSTSKMFEDSFGTFSSADRHLSAGHFESTSFSFLAIMGLQWELPDHWRLGLALQTPSLSLHDEGKFAVAESADDYAFYSDDVDAENESPLRLSIGIARQVPHEYAYGLDVSFHPDRDSKALGVGLFEGAGKVSLWTRRRDVVDFNLGGEYYVTERIPVRAGFYTSFSSADDIEAEDALTTSDIDLYGATFSVGYESGRSSTNVGIAFMYGDGHDIGEVRNADGSTSAARVDASESHVFLFVSTSFFL